VHGNDDVRCGRDAHLLARLLGDFTATERRRRQGIEDGGGELELGFAGLAARQEGGTIRLDRGSRGGGAL
jgi:hypothetical protein